LWSFVRDCRVLKAWHLYTQALQGGMGKGRRNKVFKLTAAKVNYTSKHRVYETTSLNTKSFRSKNVDSKVPV
jgi:hypothetical protein